MNKLKLPYPKEEYFVDYVEKVIWLRGSLSRAWARKGLSAQYGYEIKLATQDYLNELNSQ